MIKKTFILSSGSPRRQELLKEAGIDFTLRVIETDESFPDDIDVSKVAEHIAIKKAEAHQSIVKENEIVITADTVVCMDDKVYGKPTSKENAIEMLVGFSNKTHQVYTGVCLFSKEKKESFTCKSEVTFDVITHDDAAYYFDRDNPLDKAGAYGIQDWIGRCKVLKIEGSYTNIIGLPVPQTVRRLKRF